MLFLIFESWYHFLPGVEIVLCICFTAGLSVGVQFTNSLEFFSGCLEDKKRKFGVGYGVFPMALGGLTSALVGLQLEPQLKEHCRNNLMDAAYCITRSPSVGAITSQCGAIW